jgi:hypothetical protein
MAKIKVKKLQIGMTLTADVCDPNGRFLLGEGCELNEKHIKALSAWGVISVEVNDDDVPESEDTIEISPEIYQAIEAQVSARFRHNDMEIPFIKELATESVRFFVEQLGE